MKAKTTPIKKYIKLNIKIVPPYLN